MAVADISHETEVPSSATDPSVSENDGLLTEPQVKARVRKSVLKTAVVFTLLAMAAVLGAAFHGRARKPTEEMELFAHDFDYEQYEEVDVGSDASDRALYGGRCIEYTQLTAHRNLQRAAENCLRTIANVGCSSGNAYFVDYWQILSGGTWYVTCRCIC